MNLDTADFRHEYDLEALERIRPRGCDFEMLVTPRYLEHFVASQYEAFAAALMGAMSRSHRLFLDIGAHYGFFSLLVAARNPEIEILALEPVPETHEVLVRNFALNGLTRAEALRRAASDRAGRTRFNVSLSSDNCGFYPHPEVPPIGEIEVETATVDQLLADREPCPTLVKIDTDGHELPVLDGMSETLARFPDLKLLIELNPKMQRLAGHEPEELLAELGRLGFEVYLLDESVRRAYRMGHPAAWRELMVHPESYVNLYCCRQETSLSVCFFSHSSALAGAERSLLELATELVEDHGAICTVVLPEDGPLKPDLERAGAATLVAPYAWWCDTPYDSVGPEPRGTDFGERLAPSAREILGEPCRELRRIDPHLLVTNTLVIPWGAFLAPILGRPHVWNICEFGDRNDDLDFLLPFAELVGVVRDSSSYVFTAIDGIRERMFPEADDSFCRTLYRHIDVPEMPPERDASGLFRKPGATRLGLFGLYSPAKGQDVAVLAVAELVGRGRQIELLLAGHGRDRFEERLRELVDQYALEDSVRIEGFLDDPYSAMSETDIVIVASQVEAFSRVTVEAMLLGKPVVYPALGGPAEYMEDGATGLAYPAGDPSGLAEVIERLIADPELRSALGRQAREYARRRFTREAYGGAAVEILRRLRGAEPRAAPRWMLLLAAALADVEAENRRLTEQAEALASEHRIALEEAQALAADLERLRQENRELRAEGERLAGRLAPLEAEVPALRADLAESRRFLETILGGATWTVAVVLRKPIDLVAPIGSRRRQRLKDVVHWRRRFTRSR